MNYFLYNKIQSILLCKVINFYDLIKEIDPTVKVNILVYFWMNFEILRSDMAVILFRKLFDIRVIIVIAKQVLRSNVI